MLKSTDSVQIPVGKMNLYSYAYYAGFYAIIYPSKYLLIHSKKLQF